MNKAAVKRMIERISTVPESYDQRTYFIASGGAAPCGTVACLAGEAVICSVPDARKGISLALLLNRTPAIIRTAEEVLGLKEGLHSVFAVDASGWPSPYREQFQAVSDGDQVAQSTVAVGYLKEALKRGTMVWESVNVPTGA